MFRFYCTTCKLVKRVQHIPKIIKDESLGNPTDRIGICDIHSRIIPQRIIKTNRPEPIIVPAKSKGRKR